MVLCRRDESDLISESIFLLASMNVWFEERWALILGLYSVGVSHTSGQNRRWRYANCFTLLLSLKQQQPHSQARQFKTHNNFYQTTLAYPHTLSPLTPPPPASRCHHRPETTTTPTSTACTPPCAPASGLSGTACSSNEPPGRMNSAC